MTNETRNNPQYYIASAWTNKEKMREVRSTMQAAGLNVVARWIDEEAESDTAAPSDAYRQDCALTDLQDVSACDVFICFIGDVGTGHHTELGFALVGGKRVVLIGTKKTNIFHYLPGMEEYDTFIEFLMTELGAA